MLQRILHFTVSALPGLFALAGLALLGQFASTWLGRLGLGLPGPVLGLAAYVGLMAAVPAFARATQPGAELLLKLLGVLITPAAVGLALHRDELASEAGRLALVLLASTVITGLATAWAYKALRKWSGRKGSERK